MHKLEEALRVLNEEDTQVHLLDTQKHFKHTLPEFLSSATRIYLNTSVRQVN